MKLKILAVIALGAVGVAAVVYAVGGVSSGVGVHDRLPHQCRHHGRRHRRRRGDRDPRAAGPVRPGLRGRPVHRVGWGHSAHVDHHVAGQGGQGRGRRHGRQGGRPRDRQHDGPQARPRRRPKRSRVRGRQPPRREVVPVGRRGRRRHGADPPGEDRPLQRQEPVRGREAEGRRSQGADRGRDDHGPDRGDRDRGEHHPRVRCPEW